MAEQLFNIISFGAVGDGAALNTASIQRAIDAAGQAGGGIVSFPPGTYRSGMLLMRSHVTLRLDAGATLLGSDRLEDYPSGVASFVDAVGEERGRCLILAHRVKHVGFEGTGIIDGNGAAFRDPAKYRGRPFLVRFVDCADVSVRDVTLKNSAGWVSHYLGCDRVRIEKVKINSRVNANNDGIDIDSCADVEISGCTIDTGDDAVCLKSTIAKPCERVRVRDCRLSSGCGAIKIGTESYGDFRDIDIRDCHVHDTGLCGIKVISMDGAILTNVIISDITMERTTGPIFIRLGDRGRTYGEDAGARRPAGRIKGLVLRNITAEVETPSSPVTNPFTQMQEPPKAFSGMTITGVPGHPIEDLLLENLSIRLIGGGEPADASMQPTEQVADYPEHFYFGILPGWAMFVRHARGVTLRKVQFGTQNPDARPPIVCEDVEALVQENCSDGIAAGRITVIHRG